MLENTSRRMQRTEEHLFQRKNRMKNRCFQKAPGWEYREPFSSFVWRFSAETVTCCLTDGEGDAGVVILGHQAAVSHSLLCTLLDCRAEVGQ